MAIKIFCGIMIGIFYYALNNLFAFMSALDSVPSIISAILPSVMMTLAAIIAMWYVERRSWQQIQQKRRFGAFTVAGD